MSAVEPCTENEALLAAIVPLLYCNVLGPFATVEKKAEAAVSRRRHVGPGHCHVAAVLQQAACAIDNGNRAVCHADAGAIRRFHTRVPAASGNGDVHVASGDHASGPGRLKSHFSAAEAGDGDAAARQHDLTARTGVDAHVIAACPERDDHIGRRDRAARASRRDQCSRLPRRS